MVVGPFFAEKRIRQAIGHAIDAKGIITFVNKVACELMQCEMRDLVGKSIVTVYENEKDARETNRKLYMSGGIIHLHESKMKTKTGKVVPVRISAAHLKDSAGNYIGGVGFFQANFVPPGGRSKDCTVSHSPGASPGRKSTKRPTRSDRTTDWSKVTAPKR